MEILPELCHLFKVRVKGREELSSTGDTEVRTSSGSTEHVEAAEEWKPERRPKGGEALAFSTFSEWLKVLN